MATIQLDIPDTLVEELKSQAQRLGYPGLAEMLKATLRSLLLRQRLEQAEATVRSQVNQDLA